MDEVSDEIRECTRRKLELFQSIRNKDVKEHGLPFWDIVVLTAVDEKQKHAYDLQIESKVRRGELPKGVNYVVVSDPPGTKVGNGGATLHAIEILEKDLGSQFLHQCKVLMLHAGGYSQRFPSASVLGKIFTAVPYGNPVFQMFEVKLALCIEFPAKMEPGVFISCPDVMEPSSLNDDWGFTRPGITAIAHPSTVDVATTHGVFVFEEKPHENCHKRLELPSVTQLSCIQFLHKPSKEKMQEANAVFLIKNEEFVYTDGEFYMDWPTASKLVKLYQRLCPLNCEIDAFGDFLQALGQKSNKEYCKNNANVVEVVPKLVETREKFFDVLQGTQFNVLLFNKSRFYHIGTMMEYIESFGDSPMRYEMCFSNQAIVKCLNTMPVDLPKSTCVLSTILDSNVTIGEQCVLEYCDIQSDVTIGNGCIVSNLVIPSGATIPVHCFLHTLCVVANNKHLFVTVVFNIHDNVKKIMPIDQMNVLKFCGKSLDKALKHLAIKPEELWPNNCSTKNLWHARLFGAATSQEKSSLHAIKMAHAVIAGNVVEDEVNELFTSNRFSMADIVRCKDAQRMLENREALQKKLTDC